MQYGQTALEIGTTVKLARALWIVPVTFFFAAIASRSQSDGEEKVPRKYPWFILGFIVMAGLYTYFVSYRAVFREIEYVAKRALVLTLFFIGSNLNQETLKSMGFKPLIQAVSLWLVVASISLLAIGLSWISVP